MNASRASCQTIRFCHIDWINLRLDISQSLGTPGGALDWGGYVTHKVVKVSLFVGSRCLKGRRRHKLRIIL